MMRWLVLLACVACGPSTSAPSRTAAPPTPAAVAAPVPSAALKPASRTRVVATSDTWTFKESGLLPSYAPIVTAGRPEQAFVTSDGNHLIVVDNDRSYQVRSPGQTTTNPTRALVWPYARISPRGDYAVLVTKEAGSRATMGSDIGVLRFSDHAIVATVEGGADPLWIGDATLAFRVGNQAERLDLPATEPTFVGGAQKTHGCPNAALRGYTRVDESMCPGGRFSRVLAVDSAYTTWLVVDDNGTHETALRVVDLVSGTDRVLADRASHGFPLYVTASPRGTRYCMTPKADKASYKLHCGRFPEADDLVEVLDLGSDRLPQTAWLDEDRLLVSGIGIVDLAHGTKTALDAKLQATSRLEAPFGPRYVVADMGWVYLLDLENRTSTRLDDATTYGGHHVTGKAAAAGRFWATTMETKSLDAELVELRLAPM